jgi:hypothetical protein
VSTRTTIHLLVGREAVLSVTATVEEIYGRETVFLQLGTRYLTTAWEHSAMVAISGDRASVQALLDECQEALKGLDS